MVKVKYLFFQLLILVGSIIFGIFLAAIISVVINNDDFTIVTISVITAYVFNQYWFHNSETYAKYVDERRLEKERTKAESTFSYKNNVNRGYVTSMSTKETNNGVNKTSNFSVGEQKRGPSNSNTSSYSRILNEKKPTEKDEGDYDKLKRLYKQYLGAPLKLPELQAQLGKKLIHFYETTNKTVMNNLCSKEFSNMTTPIFPVNYLDQLMDDISWKINESTEALRLRDQKDLYLPIAERIDFDDCGSPALGRNNSTLMPAIHYLPVGRDFNKYIKAIEYIAVYIEYTHNNPDYSYVISICMIKFENFIPTQIYNSKTSENDFNETIEGIKKYINGLPLVFFNAEHEIKQLYANGIDFTKEKIYSETQIIERWKDRITVSNFELDKVADYYFMSCNLNNNEDCCYTIGAIFERMIDSIANKRDRYL